MHQSHSDNDDEDLGFEDVLALFKGGSFVEVESLAQQRTQQLAHILHHSNQTQSTEKRKKKSAANEKKVKDAYANVTGNGKGLRERSSKDYVSTRPQTKDYSEKMEALTMERLAVIEQIRKEQTSILKLNTWFNKEIMELAKQGARDSETFQSLVDACECLSVYSPFCLITQYSRTNIASKTQLMLNITAAETVVAPSKSAHAPPVQKQLQSNSTRPSPIVQPTMKNTLRAVSKNSGVVKAGGAGGGKGKNVGVATVRAIDGFKQLFEMG
ncbi:hypothetical protein BCR33DRAFT_739324 [Rhizoclosmatium globosum]|uniref:Uncharacterized protein n=1 Tax=Rhizoclosmatium globosum TaxID=329046 RepID=A0A1Y2C610_9FUNG|nr:hypothetical protein BCR33DRAFT_739324 [Rhizoclosmatium globosum]|eukprot:ORY42317.1 hypothetical protein BCR33DRAFT_739324 [Rhizoclosmatium globosum]